MPGQAINLDYQAFKDKQRELGEAENLVDERNSIVEEKFADFIKTQKNLAFKEA